MRVVHDCSGVFEMKGKEVIYTVNFGIEDGMLSFLCKDWVSHYIPRKHFFGIFRLIDGWSCANLPKQYVQSVYLNIDVPVIKWFINIETISTD